MATSITAWPLLASVINNGGSPLVVAYAPMVGGYVYNPGTAAQQGLAMPETLYVDIVNVAGLFNGANGGTTIAIEPGRSFTFPENLEGGRVTVNAASAGHRFSGVVYQPGADYQPPTSNFPPSQPTTLSTLGPLASRLYDQYNDDDDLLTFVASYNTLANEYVSFFATANLPIYTGLSGTLLDWVGQGLYGIERPALPSGTTQVIGPFNTYQFNTQPFNVDVIEGPPDYFLTSDDVYKRIMTWHVYKGDGKQFNIKWLKRRVMRFLTGDNGTAGQTDTTYPVGVTFGTDNQVNINLQSIHRTANGGAIFGFGLFNSFMFNELDTVSFNMPVSPLAPVFKAAMDAGVLEFPFQYTPIVNVNL